MNNEPTPTIDTPIVTAQPPVEGLVFSDIAGEEAPITPTFELPISDITRATIEQGRALKRIAPSTPFDQSQL